MLDSIAPQKAVPRFAALVLAVFVGCASQARERFAELRPGLTQPEVEALIGRPSVVIPAEVSEDGTVLVGPRWQYGDNLSTITTAATFPRTVPDRVWVVWFDPQGARQRLARTDSERDLVGGVLLRVERTNSAVRVRHSASQPLVHRRAFRLRCRCTCLFL